MLKITHIFLTMLLVCRLCLAFSGGDGSQQNPYLISTTSDIATLSASPAAWDKYFVLTNDINLVGVAISPIGTDSLRFTGNFDGGGNTISNLRLLSSDLAYVGFFGIIGTGGVVSDMNFSNAMVSGQYNSTLNVGVVAGRNMGLIDSVTVQGNVSANSMITYGGLIAGYNSGGSIIDCAAIGNVSVNYCGGGITGANDGLVSGSYLSGNVIVFKAESSTRYDCYGGGIAGICESASEIIGCSAKGIIDISIDGGTQQSSTRAGGIAAHCKAGSVIELCSFEGYIYATTAGRPAVAYGGGLVGDNAANISKSFSQASVAARADTGGTNTSSAYSGAAIGLNNANISNCHSNGSSSSQAYGGSSNINSESGGFIGRLAGGNITNSYSTATATSTNSNRSGAFAGYRTAGEFYGSFWDYQTSGFDMTDSGVGNIGTAFAGLTAASTGQMQTQSTFTSAGWDFVQVWQMSSQTGYPQIINVMMPVVLEADLMVSSVVADNDTVGLGATVGIDSVIRNTGDLASGSFYAAVYISANAAVDWDSLDGGSIAQSLLCSTLASSATVIKNFQVVMPQTEGVYYLRVKADVYGSINESDETNNWSDIIAVSVEAPAEPYGGGSGTEQSPFIIATAEHLEILATRASDWDNHFILAADIDMTGAIFTPIGNYDVGFSGTFNGNGFVIANITLTDWQSDYAGAFGLIAAGGRVENLGIVNIQIDASQAHYVGSIAGWTYGVISGCYSSGNIVGDMFVGGISGGISGTGSEIINSYSTVKITARTIPGGIVSYALIPAKLTNCYFAGTIISGDYFGGVVTFSTNATVTDTFFDTDIAGYWWTAAGQGQTTAWLTQSDNLIASGWDYEGTWHQIDGQYPILQWQQLRLWADLDADGFVDEADLVIMASQWLQEGSSLAADIYPFGGDGVVNLSDFAICAEWWRMTNGD